MPSPIHLQAYVLCSPHNPTGTLHATEDLRRTAELAAEHDVVVVIADEVHVPMTLAGAKHTPFLTAAADVADLRAAGPTRTVYLVTVKVPRAWEDANNRMLHRCDAKSRSDRVVLVDWNSLASKNPEYLYADAYHLRPGGAKAFARMVRKAFSTAQAPRLDRL